MAGGQPPRPPSPKGLQKLERELQHLLQTASQSASTGKMLYVVGWCPVTAAEVLENISDLNKAVSFACCNARACAACQTSALQYHHLHSPSEHCAVRLFSPVSASCICLCAAWAD